MVMTLSSAGEIFPLRSCRATGQRESRAAIRGSVGGSGAAGVPALSSGAWGRLGCGMLFMDNRDGAGGARTLSKAKKASRSDRYRS